MQLRIRVEAVVVVLSPPAVTGRLLIVVRLALKRMIGSLAVTHLVDHQHQATLPRPGHSHVLQFSLRLRAMVRMSDQDAGHLLAGL